MSWERECNLAHFQHSPSHWLTVILCCCLWNIGSWAEKGRERQKERYKEKQTVKRRKEMEQWDILLCTAVCEGREGCCVPVGSVGSERWPADTSSSQNSIVHMFSSLTHSPQYISWPHSYSCFLWSDIPLLLASIKPNQTHQNVLYASYM